MFFICSLCIACAFIVWKKHSMERSLLTELMSWKANAHRKPLVLYGARQVGKTWLLEEFGHRAFASVVRIDFMRQAGLSQIFEPDLDPRRIVRELQLSVGMAIDPTNTLLILDEIQEVPRALTSLKYFCEEAPEYHVAAAGSYMGIAQHEGESYPVGKVSSFTLRPMSFLEFLDATGQSGLSQAIRARDFATVSRVAPARVERCLRDYLVIGGMPEVVRTYAQTLDHVEARRVQEQILSDYDGDFGKHAPARLLERMRMAWRSLPSQLARENRRFVYGLVREGARARDFAESIQWLRDYGVVCKVPRVKALRSPLSSYEDLSAFKLFAVDVGLLGALAHLPVASVLDESRLFTEFKGALTEQFAIQELLCARHEPYYWTAERATAEVDCAIDLGGEVVPIEVKAAENLRSKSLRVACDKFGLRKGVRTSLAAYRNDGWLTNIPLWGLSQLTKADLQGHDRPR